MERCAAILQLPSASLDALSRMPEKHFSAANLPFLVELHLLAADSEIDAHKLSWQTRPARMRPLLETTLRLDSDASLEQTVKLESTVFSCPARTLVALELRCGAPGCEMRFNQSEKAQRVRFPVFNLL